MDTHPDARLRRLESDRNLAVRLKDRRRAGKLDAELLRLIREEHDRMLLKAGR